MSLPAERLPRPTEGEHFQLCLIRGELRNEDIKDALRSMVTTWAEEQMAVGNWPMVDDFMAEYPAFDYRGHYDDLIEKAIERVKELVRSGA